jgi:CheY-like chemotaxis protein
LFSVKDTGVGIPKNKQAQIFEVFSQADPSTTRTYGGTGLGLAISSRFLHLMGSELQLKSQKGKGSEFYFTLNLRIEKIPAVNKKTKAHKAAKVLVPTREIKVLLVDDVNLNNILSESVIKSIAEDVSVITATSGKEAVKKYKEEKPDIIFLDIQMPIMSGYEVARKIRVLEEKETRKKTLIIASTAGIMKSEREKCFEAGMNDFMRKPFEVSRMRDLLLKWGDFTEKATPIPASYLNTKSFDAKKLLELLGGDTDMVSYVLDTLQKENTLPQAVETLKALEPFDQNTKDVKAQAHKLKGTAANCFFNRLELLAYELETLDSYENTAYVKALIQRIEEEIQVVLNKIK